MDEFPRVIENRTASVGSPRVLIVRLSAIGDCVQTMPLACAIRDQWPEAHITWLVEKVSAPLVAACDAVDRVVVVPKGFSTSRKLLTRLRSMLKTQHYDVALDPQGLTKSGLVSWLSGARCRIGFARPAAREFNPWMQTQCVKSQQVHRVNRYLELLGPLGLTQSVVRFGIRVPAAAQSVANQIIAQHELSRGFAVLNPGAGWDSKLWPAERFGEVARGLKKQGLSSLVVWAGQREQAWAQQIVAGAPGAACLAPPTSLLELAEILRQAKLCVSADTGPLHLAAAMGTPCVALFGASSGAACGPHGDGHQVLQVALDSSRGRKRSGADNWAMRAISAGAVEQACNAVLASKCRQTPILSAA